MSSRHLASSDEDERGHAVQRLREAVAERKERARDARESAKDTQDDVEARASVRAADDQVVARERWLKAVDDHAY